jgi:hypothetical protein
MSAGVPLSAATTSMSRPFLALQKVVGSNPIIRF